MEEIENQRYQIMKKIGDGGFGEVFVVFDIRLQKQWAMKRIPKKEDPAIRECFFSEIKILTSIQHHAIPKIVDQFQDAIFYYVIMDHIYGRSLAQIDKGEINEENIRQWMLALIDILIYLHTLPTPILYLDVKPQNVLINDENQLFLIDFGNSRFLTQAQGVRCGTYGFSPSELLEGEKLGFYSDVYSFGKTFAFLLQQVPNKDIRLAVIIEKCCQDKRTERYADFHQVKQDMVLLYKRYQFHKRKIGCCYIIAISFFCIAYFLQTMRLNRNETMYLHAMKGQKYEEAITYQPQRLEGYEAAYETFLEKAKKRNNSKQAKMEALLYIESFIQEEDGIEASDIALFFALNCMEVDEMSFYKKAYEYFQMVSDKGSLYQGYEEIAIVLGTHGELEVKDVNRLQRILRKQIQQIDKIGDVLTRYHQYEVLYELYCSRRTLFLKEAYLQERSILDKMKSLCKTHQQLQDQLSIVYERYENTNYAYGLWLYQNKQYKDMNQVFQEACTYRNKKKTWTNEDYRHEAYSLYHCFEYGSNEQEKKTQINILKNALTAMQHITKLDENDLALQKLLNSKYHQWRN